MAQIQWFPGHMAKAKREIADKINLIDIGGGRRVYGLRNLVDGDLDGRRVKE